MLHSPFRDKTNLDPFWLGRTGLEPSNSLGISTVTPTRSIGSLSHASIGNLNGEDAGEGEDEDEEEELPVSTSSTGLTGSTGSFDSGRVDGVSG